MHDISRQTVLRSEALSRLANAKEEYLDVLARELRPITGLRRKRIEYLITLAAYVQTTVPSDDEFSKATIPLQGTLVDTCNYLSTKGYSRTIGTLKNDYRSLGGKAGLHLVIAEK